MTTAFEWYQYVYTTYNFTHAPLNHQTTIETPLAIYYVNSDDPTELWKYTIANGTDEQLDVQSGAGSNRLGDITAAWFDRPNDFIYFTDFDGGGHIWGWHIDITDDSLTDDTIIALGFDGDIIDINGQIEIVFWLYAGDPPDDTVFLKAYDLGLAQQATKDMGEMGVRSVELTQSVIVGTDAWFLWYWSDENVELWKYDAVANTFTEMEDCGAGTSLPDSNSQWGIAYDDSDLLFFVLKDTGDSKNYLYTYGITADSLTKGAEYNVALMLDRNVLGTSGSPWEFEKAFHITSSYAYQIHSGYKSLLKLQDLALSDEWYPGLPDDFNLETVGAITVAGDMDFIDLLTLPNSCTAELLTEFNNHKNVLALSHDGGASDPIIYHNFPNGAEVAGTREFWWGTTDNTKKSRISLTQATAYAMFFYIRNGTFQYQDIIGTHDTGVAATNNTLFHHKIIWDCVTDTYDWYISGNLEVDDGDFFTARDNISRFYITNQDNAVYTIYLDAWGDPANAGYTEGDNLTALANVIIAITDKYLITSYPVYLYEYTESIADFPRARATYGIYRTPRAEFTYQTSLSTDQLIEIYENASGTYTKAFSGRAGLPKYNNNKAQYDFNSINFGEDDLNRHVSKTVSAAGLDETVIAIVNDNSNYIYADTTSVPNIAINVTYIWDNQRLRDCLYTLAILANGYWFYGPTGYLYFRAYSNMPASGDTFSQATGNIGPPRTRKLQNQFNTWIIDGGMDPTTGAPFTKTETDDAHILQYGELVWTGRDQFPEARSQAALDAIATGLKAWQGMQNNPDEAASLITGKYYYPVGYSASYQFTHLDEFLTAQTMLIAGVRIDFKSRGMIDTAFSTNIMRRQ